MSDAQVAGFAELLRRSGRTVECAVEGASMGSIVPPGATARIRCDGAPDATAHPRGGTVVALMLGGALTVHRLVHRGRSTRARGWVVTQGDANLTCDAPVSAAQVIGTVEALRAADGAWRAVERAPRRPVRQRVIAAGARMLVCTSLELHPRIAFAAKSLIVLAMTPFVWLRPYPAGAVRRGSIAHRRAP